MQVTKRALFQRVARALKKKGLKLVVNRRGGCWSVIEGDDIAYDFDDLETVGRALDALKPWEALES